MLLVIIFAIFSIFMSVEAARFNITAGYTGLSAYESNSFYITELVRTKLGTPKYLSIVAVILALKCPLEYPPGGFKYS